MVENTIRIALGEKPNLTPQWNRGSAIRYLKSDTGIIDSISGLEKAKSMDGIVQVSIVHGIGEKVGIIKSSVDRIGFVISQAGDAKDAIEKAEKGIEVIKLQIK